MSTSRRRSRPFGWLPAACLAVACVAAAPRAATLMEPGFTDTLVGAVPSAQPNHFGGVCEDTAGNVYCSGSWSNTIWRKTPAGSFTPFLTVTGSNSQALAAVGMTLYSGDSSGNLAFADLTSPTPTLTLIGQGGSGELLDITPGCAGQDFVVSMQDGLYSVAMATGVFTTIATGLSFLPSCDCNGAGTGILVTQYDQSRLLLATLPSSTAPFGPTVNSGPDALEVHPSTGFIYIGSSDTQTIQKLDPTGTTLTTFATAVPLDGGWYPSPMAFSQDGTRLFYGTNLGAGYEIRVISGFGGLARADVRTVDATPTLVVAGTSGHAVSVSVENSGANAVNVGAVSLGFTDSLAADVTTDYVVTPDPANPTTIAAGATESFLFAVAVGAAPTTGTITIDAAFSGTDSVTAAPLADGAADTTDTWDVVDCLAVPCGDCNGDTVISILDALVAAQHGAGLVTLVGMAFSRCNVFGAVEPDPLAVVSILDALVLAQFAAGLPTTLTCC